MWTIFRRLCRTATWARACLPGRAEWRWAGTSAARQYVLGCGSAAPQFATMSLRRACTMRPTLAARGLTSACSDLKVSATCEGDCRGAQQSASIRKIDESAHGGNPEREFLFRTGEAGALLKTRDVVLGEWQMHRFGGNSEKRILFLLRAKPECY